MVYYFHIISSLPTSTSPLFLLARYIVELLLCFHELRFDERVEPFWKRLLGSSLHLEETSDSAVLAEEVLRCVEAISISSSSSLSLLPVSCTHDVEKIITLITTFGRSSPPSPCPWSELAWKRRHSLCASAAALLQCNVLRVLGSLRSHQTSGSLTAVPAELREAVLGQKV